MTKTLVKMLKIFDDLLQISQLIVVSIRCTVADTIVTDTVTVMTTTIMIRTCGNKMLHQSPLSCNNKLLQRWP